MSTLLRHMRGGALYLWIPAASALSPLLVIPALTHSYGASGWAAVAIAQSLGVAAAVIAELGWGVIGPQRVARGNEAERQSLYQSAFATKLLAFSVVAPLCALCAFLLAPGHAAAAALIAFAHCAGALSPTWFLIGCNRPGTIFRIETLPRVLLSVGVGIALYFGAPLALYGLAILLAAGLTVLLGARAVQQRAWPDAVAFRGGTQVIRQQLPLTLGRIVSVVYTALPITLVSLVSPASVPAFAAIERLMRMFLNLLSGVPSRLQSWVGSAAAEARSARSRRSLLINMALGLGGALVFAAVIPLVVPHLFSHTIQLPFLPVAIAAVLVFLICASRGYGLSLVAEHSANWIAFANIGAAAVGVGAILGLAQRWGTPGGLAGEVLAEAVGLAIQMFFLHYGLRRFAVTPLGIKR